MYFVQRLNFSLKMRQRMFQLAVISNDFSSDYKYQTEHIGHKYSRTLHQREMTELIKIS